MKPNSVLRALFAIAFPAAAWAQATLPTGASVVAGSASFSTAGNSMTVNTGSQRTIINYNTFNVGAGNSVLFNQPSSSSATLNRVLGADVSTIYGSVTSNGQIFLVNPSGIFVGPGGSFSGSSVYLSTGKISDADFLGGNIRFDPPPSGSAIRVDGRVDATDVIRFEAHQISSTGTLNSPSLVFNSEGTTTLIPPLSPIPVIPSSPPPTLEGTIVVSGTASGGSLVLYSGNGAVSGGSLVLTGGSLVLTGGIGNSSLVSAGGTVTATDITATDRESLFGSITATNFPPMSTAPLGSLRVLPGPAQFAPALTGLAGQRGNSNLVATPAQPPPPAARPQAPSLPSGTSGLVDGTITVRLSLVDPAPISLR